MHGLETMVAINVLALRMEAVLPSVVAGGVRHVDQQVTNGASWTRKARRSRPIQAWLNQPSIWSVTFSGWSSIAQCEAFSIR